jgi:hypothetical protein
MLSEPGSLFYHPKNKKLHADEARQNSTTLTCQHVTQTIMLPAVLATADDE